MIDLNLKRALDLANQTIASLEARIKKLEEDKFTKSQADGLYASKADVSETRIKSIVDSM